MNMQLKLMVLVNALTLIGFSIYFVIAEKYEFLFYVAIMVVIGLIVISTHRKVKYTNGILWLLTGWLVLHTTGGGITLPSGTRLYDFIFINLIGDPYNILKFDQVVHVYGFFTATLVLWHILKPHLKKTWGHVAVGVVVIAAGMGLGALNEVIEFLTTLFDPNNGVGGYVNTALDGVSNMIGAALAWFVITRKK